MDTKAVHMILLTRLWVDWKLARRESAKTDRRMRDCYNCRWQLWNKRQKSSFLSLQEMISDLFSHNVGVSDRIVLVQFCRKHLLMWCWFPNNVLRLLRKELSCYHISGFVNCLFVLRRDFHLTLIQGCKSCLRWGLVNHRLIMTKTPCTFICIFLSKQLLGLGLRCSWLLTIVY